MVHDFVKENDLKLVELNTAWVEKSEPRRTYTYYGKSANDFDVKHYPNISDKEFASKFNKGKGDTLFIKSNFWGPEYMCIIWFVFSETLPYKYITPITWVKIN